MDETFVMLMDVYQVVLEQSVHVVLSCKLFSFEVI